MNVYLATKCINSLQVCGDITNRFTRRTSDISKLFWKVHQCGVFVHKIFLSGTVLPVGFWNVTSVLPIIVPKIFLSGTVLPVRFWSVTSVSQIMLTKIFVFMHSKDCKETTNHFHFLLLILCSKIKYSLFKLNLIILVVNMTLNHLSKSAITFLNTILCSEF